MVLPLEQRKQHSVELQKFIDNNHQWFSDKEQDYINRLISYLAEIQSPHRGSIISSGTLEFDNHSVDHNISAMEKDFKSFFSQYDQRRDKNFSVTFPTLNEWYLNL
jgi:hypothetical protein